MLATAHLPAPAATARRPPSIVTCWAAEPVLPSAAWRVPFEWDEDIQRLGERVDDFFDRVFELASTPRYGLQQSWRPSIDVYDVADGFVVVVELPGVDEADLKVIADNGRLRIAGYAAPRHGRRRAPSRCSSRSTTARSSAIDRPARQYRRRRG